jgi:two-component system, LytTR family, response regulator
MSKLQCIIVEDEPLAVKVLSDYIAQVPFLDLKAAFKDAILATDFLRTNTVDLIFLDIHLPKLKGLAFLKTLTHPPAVIITTAYHQYAIEGFDLNVTDYLLKPFEFERFLVAVNKVRISDRAISNADEKPGKKEYLFLSVQKKKVKILFTEILYIESQREYIKIVTTKTNFITKMGTQEIESLLPPDKFIRVHRSYIISKSKIESYTNDSVTLPGITIPVGRGYRDKLEEF